MTRRQRSVLVAVIMEYVAAARPVGSQALERSGRLGIAAASIRHTMAELEELGLLSHPHTSAGRVPTQAGYRHYVDCLMEPVRLEESESDAIVKQLKRAGEGMDGVVVQACHVLSSLSRQLAVATRPVLEARPIERVEVVALAPKRLLLAVVARGGAVRATVVETQNAVAVREARVVGRFLTRVLRGRTPHEILAMLEDESIEVEPPLGPTLTRVASRLVGAIDPGTLYFEGTGYALSQPEFGDRDRLRGLMDALEARASLARELYEHTVDPGPTVVIGRENWCHEMHCMSMVSSRYRVGIGAGVVAVVGPTRMMYSRLVPVVEGVAHAITTVLGE